jgi:hypothetical protein
MLLAYMTTRQHLYRELTAASLSAWITGLLLQALALSYGWITLFLLSFALLGFGLGTFGIFFLHFELSKWWVHNIPNVHSIAGFVVGFGAISHTLIFGVLTEFTSATTTLLCIAATHALIFGIAWCSGFCDPEFFIIASDAELPVAHKGMILPPPPPVDRTVSKPSKANSSSTENDSERELGEPTPALKLLCSWRMQMLMTMFVFMVRVCVV